MAEGSPILALPERSQIKETDTFVIADINGGPDSNYKVRALAGIMPRVFEIDFEITAIDLSTIKTDVVVIFDPPTDFTSELTLSGLLPAGRTLTIKNKALTRNYVVSLVGVYQRVLYEQESVELVFDTAGAEEVAFFKGDTYWVTNGKQFREALRRPINFDVTKTIYLEENLADVDASALEVWCSVAIDSPVANVYGKSLRGFGGSATDITFTPAVDAGTPVVNFLNEGVRVKRVNCTKDAGHTASGVTVNIKAIIFSEDPLSDTLTLETDSLGVINYTQVHNYPESVTITDNGDGINQVDWVGNHSVINRRTKSNLHADWEYHFDGRTCVMIPNGVAGDPMYTCYNCYLDSISQWRSIYNSGAKATFISQGPSGQAIRQSINAVTSANEALSMTVTP